MRRYLLVAGTAATALLASLPLAMAAPPAKRGSDHHQPWVVRSAVLRADAKEFASLCRTQKEGVPEHRTFQLFPGTPGITAMRDYYHKDADGTVYWDGYDPKKPEDTVSLSIAGACTGGPVALDGVIEVGTKDYLFTPLPKRPGEYCLQEIDTLKLPPSGQKGDTVTLGSQPRRPGQVDKTPKADANSPVAIDVLVPYTPAAVTELGGVSEVEARIRYGASQLNKAFAVSHVPASVHVVHSYQTSPSGVLNENSSTMLNKLNKRADLTLGATAHALRDDYGADLVALLASIPAENSSGSADLPIPVTSGTSESAYSVTSVLSVKDWDNLGHEIGHNLGMRHDRKTVMNNGETAPGPNDTNFGWITSDNKFHTLMAYNTPCLPACKVINQYSNTVNKTTDGKALGDAKNNNAAIAQLATPLVSAYRATKATNRHTLTMSVSPAGGGSITVSEFGPYDPGTQVTLTAHPAAGYVFAGWEVDGVKQTDTTVDYQITMDKSRSVVALFNKAS
ncbi:reprolysin-like metallopeptidase [Streptomyces sp. NPDC007971]|uniref:InlB B-repeat-containing protein n=1 Tax=Streptomyces sp. NPDC007971 TaxID=3364799 RepID=UPI0036ED2D1B